MTIDIEPGANAPMKRTCQADCLEQAIVDCRVPAFGGSWAYLCAVHLEEIGTSFPDYITNITSTILHFNKNYRGRLELVSRG